MYLHGWYGEKIMQYTTSSITEIIYKQFSGVIPVFTVVSSVCNTFAELLACLLCGLLRCPTPLNQLSKSLKMGISMIFVS